jgi:hypothetical protein
MMWSTNLGQTELNAFVQRRSALCGSQAAALQLFVAEAQAGRVVLQVGKHLRLQRRLAFQQR